MMSHSSKHWFLRFDETEVAWLYLDKKEAAVNALSAEVMAELAQVLNLLEKHPPKALVISSAKKTGFIVGADINEFPELTTPEAAKEMVSRGWYLFERLERVPYPTLALINGHCLGGGLELALACRYRLVIESSETRLGLPEVMLGIFPGWGGILRLPRQVGAIDGLDMMLTGRRINSKRALKMGLIDAIVPLRVSEQVAREWGGFGS